MGFTVIGRRSTQVEFKLWTHHVLDSHGRCDNYRVGIQVARVFELETEQIRAAYSARARASALTVLPLPSLDPSKV